MAAANFTREKISIEALKDVFDAAMFDTEIDGDGDLVIRDRYLAFISIQPTVMIRFVSIFGLKKKASEKAGHALCNRINDGLVAIRASMSDKTTLILDWYLPFDSGIGKKTVVLAFRKFIDMLGALGQYDTDDIMT